MLFDNILVLLQTQPVFLYTLTILIGLMVGSFLNVVIYRLPQMLEREWQEQCQVLLNPAAETTTQEPFNLLVPRSRCGHCQQKIPAWHNIPVLSYLFLRGRCAYCQQRISLQYPLIELISALLSVWIIYHFGLTAAGLGALLLSWALIALTVIDLQQTLLPDNITLPLLWLGLLLNTFGIYTDINSAVLGAIIAYLSLWLLFQGFKWATGKEGMGYGDFKLFAALGAWFGWQALPLIILLSACAGASVGLLLIAFAGKTRSSAIPFGPWLALAGWIYLLYGESLQRYLF